MIKRLTKLLFKFILAIIIIYSFLIIFYRINSYFLKVDIEATQQTIIDARKNGFEVELTGIVQKTIDYNKTLKHYQNMCRYRILKPLFVNDFEKINPIK